MSTKGDYLYVPVYKSPIQEVRISSDLSTLEVTVEPDESGIKSTQAMGILPSGVGVKHSIDGKVFISFCRSKSELEESDPYEAADLTKAGLVHTIQYPIGSLNNQGYFSKLQMDRISDYISKQVNPRRVERDARTREWCRIL